MTNIRTRLSNANARRCTRARREHLRRSSRRLVDPLRTANQRLVETSLPELWHAAHALLDTNAELPSVDGILAFEARLDGTPLRAAEHPLTRALRGEPFEDYEVLVRRADGSIRHVVSNGTTVRDARGVTHALVICRDVTDLRVVEQRCEEYVGNIAHDLRNPLATIVMSAGLMQRSPEGYTEHAARIEKNARRMTQMVDELLEASALNSNAQLASMPVDLGQVVTDVVALMDEASAQRLVIEGGATSYPVVADVPRLQRCIVNLLSNALKYSSTTNPVVIRLARAGRQVELDVVDCGIGIPAADVERVFERHYRTAAGRAKASGLGLGLYITRLIVEAHGGRIDVLSAVGKGSQFRLFFPLATGLAKVTPPSRARHKRSAA